MNTQTTAFFSIIAILIVALILATLLYAIVSYTLLRLKENKEQKIKKFPVYQENQTEQYILSEAQSEEAHLANTEFSQNPYMNAVDVPIIEHSHTEVPVSIDTLIPAPIFSQDTNVVEVPVVPINSKNPPPLPHLDSIFAAEMPSALPKLEKSEFLREIPMHSPPPIQQEALVSTLPEIQIPEITLIEIPEIQPEEAIFNPKDFDVPSVADVAHPIEITVASPELGAARDVQVINRSQLEVPSVEVPKLSVDFDTAAPILELPTITETIAVETQNIQETLPMVTEETIEAAAVIVTENVVSTETPAPFVVDTPTEVPTETAAPVKKNRFSLVSIDLAEVKKGQNIVQSVAVTPEPVAETQIVAEVTPVVEEQAEEQAPAIIAPQPVPQVATVQAPAVQRVEKAEWS